ncbi:MAG TPA: hypothetical protein VJH92_05440 [Candidatus Nanoarchaeia archaeon]|nr:hypothetical protein [Candidatus Nanoarchaeia archaeon]
MGENQNYKIDSMYQGGASTFKPYSTASYFPTGTLGETTFPNTINIIKEVSDKLASGTKRVEIEAIDNKILESIPKQYFKEVDRLSKLTGVEVSLHGPVMDVAGFDTRSGNWSETNRELAEKKVANTLLRGHDLSSKGNVTINFHSAEGIPGSELIAPSKRKEGERARKLIAVDRNTGRLTPLEGDIQYSPDMKELKPEVRARLERGEINIKQIDENRDYNDVPLSQGQFLTPERRLQSLNRTQWENEIDQLLFNKERADELLSKNEILIKHVYDDLNSGKINLKTIAKFPEQAEAYNKVRTIDAYIDDVYQQISTKFSKAYELGDGNQRKVLEQISGRFKQMLEQDKSPSGRSRAIGDLMLNLKDNRAVTPRTFVSIEDFAIQNSSKTFGNAAFQAYKKYKDTTPTLVIENPPAGFALSTGEDIEKLVKASRKQFMENAMKSQKEGGLGLSENDAKKAASKVIGATVDVGHINMLKAQGYTDKDIVREVEKFAPFLKHIHLSDNFGLEHTELPMGMGNVPLKEMLEKLKSKGVDVEGMTKIIEASAWWNNYKISPFHTTLEQVGPSMYSSHAAPYWNQAQGLTQNYFGGYGNFLPQVNYETFGAGFSQLPTELGGSRGQAGQGSRMSGKGME